ncbi:winged helix-turn-helix domain-containing protein [Vibrio owensii]
MRKHHVHQITTYVREVFGLDYTDPGINKSLHPDGLSYNQPRGTSHE